MPTTAAITSKPHTFVLDWINSNMAIGTKRKPFPPGSVATPELNTGNNPNQFRLFPFLSDDLPTKIYQ